MKSVGTQSSYYNSGEAAQKLGKNKKQGCFLCVNMGWCVWIWEVSKHELNLCSSIVFRGGRKAKERRKEMKTDICLLAKRNLIKMKYSIYKKKNSKMHVLFTERDPRRLPLILSSC